jgi:hypothetical protein
MAAAPGVDLEIVASASATINNTGTAAGNSDTTAQPAKSPIVQASRRARRTDAPRSATPAVNAIIRHPAQSPCPMKSVAYAHAGDATPYAVAANNAALRE